MISGRITLADVTIGFWPHPEIENYLTAVIVQENPDGSITDEILRAVPQDKFLKALAIAVHNDGMPDAEKDYPDAESIMGKIRWIP